jgi:CBS domain-containing protein
MLPPEVAAMKRMLARDIMIRPVLTVRDDRTVPELATFLIESSISGAPVLDAKGKLVGVVSLTDIAEDETSGEPAGRDNPAFFDRGWEGRINREDLKGLHVTADSKLVRDIMTPTCFTIPDDTPVSEIAKTMVAGRIHRLLVTRKGRVVGIVSTLDLLTLLAGPARPRKRSRGAASPSSGTSARAARGARTSART